MKEIVALGDLVKSIKGFKRTVLFKHAFRSSSFLLIDADIVSKSKFDPYSSHLRIEH